MTGNPYHDETGRFCSKGEMGEAVERLNQAVMSATNFEDFSAARDRYAELKGEYDAAQSGAASTSNVTDIATARAAKSAPGANDPAADFKAAIAKRTGVAVEPAAPKVPADSFALPKKHTYQPAGVLPGDGDQYYSRKFTGAKLAAMEDKNQYRSVTVIAKDIRTDLAEAQAKGYLPKGLKFSVTSEKYSGGQSLTVRIQGGRDKDLFTTGSESEQPEYGQPIYTKNAQEVLKRAQGIVDAYRYDASDPQWDYFNTNFYGFVNVESERSAQWRAGEADKARKQREVAKVRKELVTKAEQAGPDAYFGHQDRQALLTGKSKDGQARFGLVPGSEILLVERNHTFSTRDGYKQEVRREMYDMTGAASITANGGRKLEDVLSEMDERELGINLSRERFFPAKPKATRRRWA